MSNSRRIRRTLIDRKPSHTMLISELLKTHAMVHQMLGTLHEDHPYRLELETQHEQLTGWVELATRLATDGCTCDPAVRDQGHTVTILHHRDCPRCQP